MNFSFGRKKAKDGDGVLKQQTLMRKSVMILSVNTAIFIIMGLVLFNYLNTLRRLWDEYQNETVARRTYLMEIKSQFGYGGFIHNFKNYVMRGQQKYIKRIENNRISLDQAITALSSLSLSPEEQAAMEKIRSVAKAYVEKIRALAVCDLHHQPFPAV